MEAAGDLDDLTLLLKLLRALRGWGQAELAEAAGIDASSIYRYEVGKTLPPRKTVERLVAAAGLPMAFVEACLLPALRAARTLVETSETSSSVTPESPSDGTSASDSLHKALAGAARVAIAASVGNEQALFPEPWPRQADPVAEDRLDAEDAWERLRLCSHRERLFLVERAPEFRTWAVAERLSHESVVEAANDADRSIELAELAVRITRSVGGGEAWRSALHGYALALLANALRVRGDDAKAEKIAGEARDHRSAGKAMNLLPEWRIDVIEGVLQRCLGHPAESLIWIGRALEAAPRDQVGSILLTKANTFIQKGEFERAIEILLEAEPALAAQRTSRPYYTLRHNMAICFCRLGYYEKALALLVELRQLSKVLQHDLDSLRLTWIEAQLSARMGRISEAHSKFESAFNAFASRDLELECAEIYEEWSELPPRARSDIIEVEAASLDRAAHPIDLEQTSPVSASEELPAD